jgi:hypothetical protein
VVFVPVLVLQGLLQVPLQQCASSLQLLNCSGQHCHLVVWWANWYVELTKGVWWVLGQSCNPGDIVGGGPDRTEDWLGRLVWGVLRAGLVDSSWSGHGSGLDGGGLGSYLGIGGLVSDLVGSGVVWPELGLGTDRPGARSEFVLFSAGLGLLVT